MFAKSLILAATLALTSEAVKIKSGLAANALAGVNIRALSQAELKALLTATAGQYGEYCHNHGKHYLSEAEREERQKNWLEQQSYNQSHNANENSSCTLGDNQFSDMSAEEKSKANGTKAPVDDDHHEELMLARAMRKVNRFYVKMTTEQYQATYDHRWGNKSAKGWTCEDFDAWFNEKDANFMERKEAQKRDRKMSRGWTEDEFDAWWMRIMQDRTVAQASIMRCFGEDEEQHHEEEEQQEEEQQDDNVDPEPEPEPAQCNADMDSFIWGDDVVTPIKNQGQCGSCYSFSAMTVLESAKAILTGQPVMAFSEQQIVDCQNNYSNCYGCSGGWPVSMHESTRQYPVATEASYPYTGNEGSCQQANSSEWVSATDVYYIDGTPEAVKAELCHGPITLTVRANGPFMSYSGGVMTSADCPYNNDLDHAVAATGWTVMDGQEVLVVRNSWGTWWGDNGYIYMAMDDGNNGMGPCGIFQYMSSANVSNDGSA